MSALRAQYAQCGLPKLLASSAPEARTLRRGEKSSIGVLALENDPYRFRDDVQVQAQRPVAQVVQVVIDARLHLFQRLGFAALAVDLGPAGDSRLDLVPLHVSLDQLA